MTVSSVSSSGRVISIETKQANLPGTIPERWVIHRDEIEEVLGFFLVIREKVGQHLRSIPSDESEASRFTNMIESLKRKKDTVSAPTSPKIEQAKTGSNAPGKLQELEKELAAVTATREAAERAFHAAVQLNKNPNKGNHAKTNKNQKWLILQQNKGRAETAYKKVLDKYELCKTFCTKEEEKGQVQPEELSKIDKEMGGYEKRLVSIENRRKNYFHEIEALTTQAKRAIDSYIAKYIDVGDVDLQLYARSQLEEMLSFFSGKS